VRVVRLRRRAANGRGEREIPHIRRLTLSQEWKEKKKSACSVRNDAVVRRAGQAAFWNLRLAV